MEFCPNCGKLLTPKEEKGSVFLACAKCGYKKEPAKIDDYIKVETKSEADKEEGIAINEGALNLPTTTTNCPNANCGSEKAYYWLEQTRAADEAPTRFYQCLKCGHKWREYS